MKKQLLLFIAGSLASLQLLAQCTSCPIPYVASSQAVGTSAGVTVNKPTGVQPGDLMIAAIHIGWCNSGPAVTAPSGWILINYTSNTGTGCGSQNTSKQLHTFYKIVGNAEPSSYTFTGNASNQYYVGAIVAYSGVNTTTPINASSTFGTQDACNNIVANSVTTTASCTRLVGVFFCSVNSSQTNIVPQNSMTERVEVSTTGNHPWGNEDVEVADEFMSAMGVSGNRTAGLTGCSSTGWVTGGQLIALNCQSSTGMSDVPISSLVSVSPNPSSGVLNIVFAGNRDSSADVEIYNTLGEKVFVSAQVSSFIDLGTLSKGIYFMKIILQEGTVTKKIVLE
jgi:hypothetical protein